MTNTVDRRSIIAGTVAAAAAALVGEAATADRSIGQQPQAGRSQAQPTPINPIAADKPATDTRVNFQLLDQPQIRSLPADSERPLNRADETLWKSILDRAKTTYTAPRSLAGPPPTSILRIDHGFKFSPASTDDDLSAFHVELLLDQAADLLERGTRDRAEWQEKAVRAFNVGLEIAEFEELDKIHNDEIQAGYYTLPYKEATALLRAETQSQIGNRTAAYYLDSLLGENYSLDAENEQSAREQLFAWTAHLAAYEKPDVGNLVNVTWNSVPNTIPLFLQDAAFKQSFYGFRSQASLLLSDSASHSGLQAASAARSPGLSARADWTFQDIEFRRRRTQAARDITDAKIRAATEPGGALNFPEQMLTIQNRFARDFREVIACLSAAADGLTKFYGYSVALPATLVSTKAGAANQGDLFEDCLLWTRDAIAWMVRFGRMDQNHVAPISLRRLLKDAEWEQGKRTGVWTVGISDKEFADQRHVRLRGVSVQVVLDCDDRDGVWQSTVRAPATSYCVHLDESCVDLDQKGLAPIRSPRTSTREAIRSPDVMGIMTMHNASPFGSWIVTLSESSSQGVKRGTVRDVVLDLYAASRYRRPSATA